MSGTSNPQHEPRRPQVFDADDPLVRPVEQESDQSDTIDPTAVPAETRQTEPSSNSERGDQFRLGAILFAALASLIALATGLWFTHFVSIALSRTDWIGWAANGLALLIAAILVVLLLKEFLGWLRLSRLANLRRDADAAIAGGDLVMEKRVVRRLKSLAAGRAESRWALAAFREEERIRPTNCF